MAIYLIDYENVKSNGLKGVSKLDQFDRVYIFYSVNAETLTFEVHQQINESQADVSYIKIDAGGKNALDFQLSTYLGYLVAQENEEQFYIVSDDTGFDFVIKFWSKHKKKINKVSNLLLQSKMNEQQLLLEKIMELLPQYKEEAAVIRKFINDYKTKQGLNNALVKQYESKKAGEIYKAIKPLIADKKGK
jgi:hypothetical protein